MTELQLYLSSLPNGRLIVALSILVKPLVDCAIQWPLVDDEIADRLSEAPNQTLYSFSPDLIFKFLEEAILL